MQTYLGIDVGSYSIKVAIIKISSSAYYIEDVFEQEIQYLPDVEKKVSKIQCLKSILARVDKLELDSVYASLGIQDTVMKKFDLNHVKRADRQKIIESEFDLLGIFDLDNYSIEYYTIKFDKNFAKILAILIHKEKAKELIDVLEHCDLNVRIIDVDNIAILNLMNFLPKVDVGFNRGTELFIDIGHSKTSLTVIENRKILQARSFRYAGDQLTRKIQQSLNISYDEAQKYKNNLSLMESDREFLKVQKALNSFYEELFAELSRSLKILNASEFTKIDRVYVRGGTAKLKGFESQLENFLQIPTHQFVLESEKLKIANPQNMDYLVFSQVLGNAFRGDLEISHSKINIRHGDLAVVGNHEKIISEVFHYSKLIIIFFMVLLGTYLLRDFLFNHRITQIKTQYKSMVVKMLAKEPNELKFISSKSNWDLEDYSEKTIKFVNETKQAKKDLIDKLSLSNPSIPLKVINDISLAVPKSTYFEITDFKYQDGIIRIEADSDSSATVQSILEKLNTVKSINQVSKSSEVKKPGSDTDLIHFVVTANAALKGE